MLGTWLVDESQIRLAAERGREKEKKLYRRGKNESPVVRKRERCCG